MQRISVATQFLSIQAQDFIEDHGCRKVGCDALKFLSIQAQDFIEDQRFQLFPCQAHNS